MFTLQLYTSPHLPDQDFKLKLKFQLILHVASPGQLKLGMDLTKVVLPTFILERKSLLELFANCFSHPDIFMSISDGRFVVRTWLGYVTVNLEL